jgi:undecaprenyl-diphosphatase
MNVRLLLLINGWAGENRALDNFMIFCAKDLIYIIFLIALLWLILSDKKDWRPSAYFLTNLAVAFIFLQIAGMLYVDHRPFVDYRLTQLISHAAGKSFPSDHTTAAFAIAFSFVLFTPYKKASLGLFLAAALIGFARIFTGLHYPIDIFGGLVVASMAAIISKTGVIYASQKTKR